MLELRDIGVKYMQGGAPVSVLENINLTVEKGECLAIVGSSGCGKTTLLNLIAGLKLPTKGTVLYKNTEVKNPVEEISVVFQNYGLFPWKTVRENILLPLTLRHKKNHSSEANHLIQQLGLAEHAEKYPCQLSGGQRQRVSIGRALLGDSEMILMDEPFSALDPMISETLRWNIRKLFWEKNMTSVIVTHSIKEAVLFGDKIAVFAKEGKQIAEVIDNPLLREEHFEETEAFQEMQNLVKRKLAG